MELLIEQIDGTATRVLASEVRQKGFTVTTTDGMDSQTYLNVKTVMVKPECNVCGCAAVKMNGRLVQLHTLEHLMLIEA